MHFFTRMLQRNPQNRWSPLHVWSINDVTGNPLLRTGEKKSQAQAHANFWYKNPNFFFKPVP